LNNQQWKWHQYKPQKHNTSNNHNHSAWIKTERLKTRTETTTPTQKRPRSRTTVMKQNSTVKQLEIANRWLGGGVMLVGDSHSLQRRTTLHRVTVDDNRKSVSLFLVSSLFMTNNKRWIFLYENNVVCKS